MILSMTGYGAGTCQVEATGVTVEVRSVNHRFLDVHVRAPREYSCLESEIQKAIKERLKRGRVDVTVSIQASVSPEVQVNVETARSYLAAVGKLRSEIGLQDSLDVKTLLSLPGVLQGRDFVQEQQEAERSPVRGMVIQSLHQALETLLEMRASEGTALETELLAHLECIAKNLGQIAVCGPVMVLECRNRLQERLAQVLSDNVVDPQRIAQEVALVAEKSDISEEIARLESHLTQFRALIDMGQEVGKKMDFLLQEMQRESNTILSKSGSLDITRDALAVKSDIEKLREQVQNIE